MIGRFIGKSETGKNVVTLAVGSTIAQAIPIAVSPILTRMYTPSDFGVLAIYMSITAIFGSIANGRFELAVMLPEDDQDAVNVAALGLLSAGCLSVVLLLTVHFANAAICGFLNNDQIALWLYFVPLSVFCVGLFNVLVSLNNRWKLYRPIANANIHKSCALISGQIGVGMMRTGPIGLIVGQILSGVGANVGLAKNVKKKVGSFDGVSRSRMGKLGREYINFPLYSAPAILANTLAQNLTNILVSTVYSVSSLGFYSLTQRVLGMPTVLIGRSIGQVFFQKATEEKRRVGNATRIFNATVKRLAVIALPTFTVIYFVVEPLFAFVFGDEWGVAGEYAKILTPLFAVRFVVASVSNINNVFERQKIALVWQITLLVLSISSIALAKRYEMNVVDWLYLFSSLCACHYVVLFFILKQVARGRG